MATTVAAVVWMAVIFRLSSLTGSSVPGRFSVLGHFVVYAVLGALYVRALPSTLPIGRRILVAVALASLYGVTDEYHQSFVPGRMPDIADWAVDTIGATAGAFAAMTAPLLVKRRTSRDDSGRPTDRA